MCVCVHSSAGDCKRERVQPVNMIYIHICRHFRNLGSCPRYSCFHFFFVQYPISCHDTLGIETLEFQILEIKLNNLLQFLQKKMIEILMFIVMTYSFGH